ncbi:GIY-YIG nuclease family protein [Peribacillus cavernae]|uniref:GIY-YIG nuclease family protein n=1 Tax=Peribacillus cavernae TaxID=1674310 RepID=UPI00351FED38
MLSQVSTALPEMPTIEYIIKTSDASLLETMLHSILKIRGKKIENSPGSEWFDTNPEEVIELIEFVNKKLLDS